MTTEERAKAAATNYAAQMPAIRDGRIAFDAFLAGARWQAERGKTECDTIKNQLQQILRCWQDGIGDIGNNSWRRKMAELVGDKELLEEESSSYPQT